MRSWIATAVLAWVTSTLVTSPLLAARNCLDCCSRRLMTVAASPSTVVCDHCRPQGAEQPACCAATAPTTGDSCDGCPRCESSRPSPMTPVVPVAPWQAMDLPIATVAALPRPVLSAADRAWLPETAAGRVPHPPLQILHCSWLN
uniref:Uncharacterized protein n=1 Tax=Schlesneria paludicola TaxID=360056 RepID=A0A7C2JYL8_9PLAN